MQQLNLYLGNDETKQTFRFFLPIYRTEDRQALYTPKMQFPQTIHAGSRLIIKYHKELCLKTRRMSKRYRLFIDESQANPLPGSNGSKAYARFRQKH